MSRHPFVESTRAVARQRMRLCIEALERVAHYSTMPGPDAREERDRAIGAAQWAAVHALRELDKAEQLEEVGDA